MQALLLGLLTMLAANATAETYGKWCGALEVEKTFALVEDKYEVYALYYGWDQQCRLEFREEDIAAGQARYVKGLFSKAEQKDGRVEVCIEGSIGGGPACGWTAFFTSVDRFSNGEIVRD